MLQPPREIQCRVKDNPAMNPLDGLRVLDLTRLLPGAICTLMLADLGAEIIKVEDPHGGDYGRWLPPLIDGQGAFFRASNRGKRSLIVDLKQLEGQAVLHRLVRGADVLIEGFRPGVMQRLGCDYAGLSGENPRLIYCALSGWGATGPYAADSGHDLNYAVAAGLVGAMRTPQPLGAQVADVGGAYAAVAAITAALLRRERSGEGAYLDIGLAEAALPFAMYAWIEAQVQGTGGGQGALTGGLACYAVYAAADGQPVALAALEEKFWSAFCEAVARPDLIPDHQNPARQPALRAALTALFATRSAADWDAHLCGVDCCFSVVRGPASVHDDGHFQARGMLGVSPDGSAWMRSPLRVSGSEPDVHADVPGYGEHSRDILAESGFSQGEIEQLIHAGIIKVV
jgi:crotonobetainyl-CoA:carnitine CoA-transferase CaiB-like acyl-CoA transferase